MDERQAFAWLTSPSVFARVRAPESFTARAACTVGGDYEVPLSRGACPDGP